VSGTGRVKASVRTYDFQRAMRFSKDQVRIIARIHEYFARLWATHLSAELRSGVQMQLESVEEVRYDELMGLISPLTLVQVFQMLPSEGDILAEINLQVVFAIIDRLIGGPGEGPYRERELTNIELSLLNRVLTTMGEDLAVAWRSVVSSNIELRRGPIEHNPQFLQVAMPNETVLVVTIAAQIGSVRGLINLWLPHGTLKPLMPELTHRRADGATSGRVQAAQDRLLPRLKVVDVTVSAELGEARLSLAEVLGLRVGDVIRLEQPIARPITVRVDGVPAYIASVGTAHRHYAVKIIEECTGVDDNDG
jgi:flagellar motor switch protein FliM